MEQDNNTIKVVLRTRPTQHFATKNITLDSLENVTKNNIKIR
jgi:hypothetical protein